MRATKIPHIKESERQSRYLHHKCHIFILTSHFSCLYFFRVLALCGGGRCKEVIPTQWQYDGHIEGGLSTATNNITSHLRIFYTNHHPLILGHRGGNICGSWIYNYLCNQCPLPLKL
jgi:hypothetical protein